LTVFEKILGAAANGKIDGKRLGIFLAFVAVAGVMFYGPFREVMRVALRSDYYSHIVLIPFVSAYLLFVRRREIFADIGYAFVPGAAVAGVGVLLYGIARMVPLGLNKNDFSALVTLAALFFVVGAFVLLFGLQAFRAARFALLFLLFMVPVPTALMDGTIRFLQVGTTEFVALLFAIAPVPVLREGFVFHLPNISIEVAPQCSGIRSSMALVITSVLAGHMFLKKGWNKALLVLAVTPRDDVQERDPDHHAVAVGGVCGHAHPDKFDAAHGWGNLVLRARLIANGSDSFCAQEGRAAEVVASAGEELKKWWLVASGGKSEKVICG